MGTTKYQVKVNIEIAEFQEHSKVGIALSTQSRRLTTNSTTKFSGAQVFVNKIIDKITDGELIEGLILVDKSND